MLDALVAEKHRGGYGVSPQEAFFAAFQMMKRRAAAVLVDEPPNWRGANLTGSGAVLLIRHPPFA
jgi:hypothetical protein